MKELLLIQFGLHLTKSTKLVGYDNENYRIETSEKKYILKTYSDLALFPLLEAENEALNYLEMTATLNHPTPIKFLDGSTIKTVIIAGEKKIVRLLTYLEGTFLGDVTTTKSAIPTLGKFLAQLNKNLMQWVHPAIKARIWEWNLESYAIIKDFIPEIESPKNQNIVRYFIQQYETEVVPLYPKLRKATLHNDANEWNILIQKNQTIGIIDFGDITYSHLINEVAIAMTYISYDKEEPLKWATQLLDAYHQELPLLPEEIEVLYHTIALRLCQSVCNAAHSKKQNPENSYITQSEKDAWSMLYRWLAINPKGATNQFRNAVGLIPHQAPPIKSMISKRHELMSPIVSLSYKDPIPMEKAAFQYMYDTAGNTFLDAYNNIPHVGHTHPKVVAAGQKQMATLNTNTRYLYKQLPHYASKLLAKFPPKLNKVFFVNSGSEASDLAIRMARAHTQWHNLMVMEHGYHGHTQVGIEISDYKFNNPKGIGQQQHIVAVPLPTSPKGITTLKATSLVSKATEALEIFNQPIAAFICETILGCAGQVPLPEGFLKKLYPIIRKKGGLCIVDEVQTGFGRVGNSFWAFEAQEVIPDMVIIGKPMANGHPMGAVVTTEAVAASFEKGVEFFSSFGGNPVSCAIAAATLDVIEEEKLQENALIVGQYYKELFQELQKKHSCIADVRGKGLFLGVELIDGIGNPNTQLAQNVKNKMRDQHILISTDGPYDNVLKTKPPLCFTKENALLVVESLNKILLQMVD